MRRQLAAFRADKTCTSITDVTSTRSVTSAGIKSPPRRSLPPTPARDLLHLDRRKAAQLVENGTTVETHPPPDCLGHQDAHSLLNETSECRSRASIAPTEVRDPVEEGITRDIACHDLQHQSIYQGKTRKKYPHGMTTALFREHQATLPLSGEGFHSPFPLCRRLKQSFRMRDSNANPTEGNISQHRTSIIKGANKPRSIAACHRRQHASLGRKSLR